MGLGKLLEGIAEVAGGIALTVATAGAAAPIGSMLIGAGLGTVISGLGTMLSGSPISGIATATRQSIAPYKVLYGRNRVGGTLVYQWNWGALANQTNVNYRRMLDMVLILACHPCQNEVNDTQVFLDQKRLIVNPGGVAFPTAGGWTHYPESNSGTSYVPQKQNVNIESIKRDANGIVTVICTDVIDVYFPGTGVIDYLQAGDQIQINDTDSSGTDLADNNLAGMFTVSQILSNSPLSFTVLNGGAAVGPLINEGVVNTFVDWGDGQGSQCFTWANYYDTAYVEFLSGGQKVPTGPSNYEYGTFVGQLVGTPFLGNISKIVTPESPHQAGSYGGNEALNILSFTILGGNSEVAAQSNPWTANCTLQDKTAAFLRLTYSTVTSTGAPVFSSIPQISFHMKGRNQIYDPRLATNTPNWSTSQPDIDFAFTGAPVVSPLATKMGQIDIANPQAYAYTENSALCIADFLSNVEFGYALQYGSDIPIGGTFGLTAAANICDESVELLEGGTEPRYACNGSFNLDQKRGEILQHLLTSCGGRLVYSQGQYFIQPAKWVDSSATINLVDIAVGPIKWMPKVSRKDLPNRVAGTYISPYNRWISTDFPAYAQDNMHNYDPEHLLPQYGGDINLAYDLGQRRTQQIQLPFTISSATAQRLAKIEMLRQRWQGVGTFTLNMAGYQFQALDIISAVVPQFGWTTEEPTILEIDAVRLRPEKIGETVVLLTEIDVHSVDQSIYDWSIDEELNPEGDQVVFPSLNYVNETVPLPWSPGFINPLPGDALVYAIPASFGAQAWYGVDSGGNANVSIQISGTSPINTVYADIVPPYVVASASPTGGTIPPGDYVVAASGFDNGSSTHRYTPYCNYSHVTVPGNTGISTLTLLTGGVLFTAGDVVNLTGGTGGTIIVDSATPNGTPGPGYSPGGAITSFSLNTPGSGYSLGTTNGYKIGGGAGGATFTITALTAETLTNSIVVDLGWGPGDGGGLLYMAEWNNSSTDSYVFHPVNSLPLDGSETNVTITSYDETTGPEVDPMFDHFGVTYQQELHGGPWADQTFYVTSNTLSFGAPGMTSNQWAGYTISMIGKFDPEVPCPILNLPIVSSTASGINNEFVLTIGPGPDGNTIDLTSAYGGSGQLCEIGDLFCMRHNATFTDTSFSDPNIANGFYPGGATGVEAGHLAVVLTGPDAGDVQTIASVTGGYTTFNLIGQWNVTPHTGDIVIICAASSSQETKTGKISSPSANNTGIMATVNGSNIIGKVWLFRVRAEDINDNSCSDAYTPWRDLYVYQVSVDKATWDLGIGAAQQVGSDLAPHYNVRANNPAYYTHGYLIEATGNCKAPGISGLPLNIDILVSKDNCVTWNSVFQSGNILSIPTVGGNVTQATQTVFSTVYDTVDIGDFLRIDLLPGSDTGSSEIEVVLRWGVA